MPIPLRETDSLRRLTMIENSILEQYRSSIPIVMPWLASLLCCIPSRMVLSFVKKAGTNGHIASMSSFPGPSECMGIFGDCVVRDMMWQNCSIARTKRKAFTILSGIWDIFKDTKVIWFYMIWC
jgi:hypothetical protein